MTAEKPDMENMISKRQTVRSVLGNSVFVLLFILAIVAANRAASLGAESSNEDVLLLLEYGPLSVMAASALALVIIAIRKRQLEQLPIYITFFGATSFMLLAELLPPALGTGFSIASWGFLIVGVAAFVVPLLARAK